MVKNVTPRWNPYGLAGAFGIFWGFYMFVLALFMQAGMNVAGFGRSMFEMLRGTYLSTAYSATFGGAVVGLGIGFICGAICGLIIAWLYNWTSSKFPGK